MSPRIKIILEIPTEEKQLNGKTFYEQIIFHEEDMERFSIEKGGRAGILVPNKLGDSGYLRVHATLPLSKEQYDTINCLELC